MNRFWSNLHSVFLDPETWDFWRDKAENYPSATQTPETKTQMDREKQVQQAVDVAQENENALADTVVQTPDFSNIAWKVASEISTKYTDKEQFRADLSRFQERLKSKNNNGKWEEYTKVWEKKIKEGYDKLIKSLEENKYFDDCKDNDAKNKKIQDVMVRYSKEVNAQYEKYIWSAGNKTFNRVKDTIFWGNTWDYKDYPAEKIYNQLTGATSISRVDREYTEWYESDILDRTDIDDNNESLSERKNRSFLADDLTQYLWNIRKTPWIINALKWLPIFTVEEDRPSKVDRKAIKQFLKVSSKIEVEWDKDKAIALMEVFHDSSLNTDSGEKDYKLALAKSGIKVEEKYIDDIVKAGNFYINTQREDNAVRDQHAIYLSIIKIIETEGWVDNAVKKFKSIVEQGKKDKKSEKKEGYESGEKLWATNPELYEIAKNLWITDFTSATRLSEKNAEYFWNTPVEKILANLNNDRTLDARDSLTGGSKSWTQFLEVFKYVGKEKALKNLVERAKLQNKALWIGLPEELLKADTIEEDIKSGHFWLILLLQDIINKPGEDLYTLLSGESPIEGDLKIMKEANEASKEMLKKMKLDALKNDGLTLPTPESMQSWLATAFYTEYKRWIWLWNRISFDQWIKWVSMNTWFQFRNDGTVTVWIGLDYSTKINLWKWWSTTPELSAWAFIPLGMWKPELSGSIGFNDETAKEWITKKWIKEHLWVQGGVTMMPAGVYVVSGWFKWEQDKAAWIEVAEQEKMTEFKDKIIGSVLTKAFEQRKMIKSPYATKIDFNDDTKPTRVETFKKAISDVANSKDEKGNILVPEKDQKLVTDAVMRLLLNYNGEDLGEEWVKEVIAQKIAEKYAMAWAEDRRAHITDKAYLSWANLGVFWVVGSPLVWIYAWVKFTKHDLDGYGDRWWDRQEVAQEYQWEWNQKMLDSFNQQLWLSGDKQIKLENWFVVIPAGLKHRVNVNEKMHGLMMKDKNGNILLHTQTPMATDVKKWAATQWGEVIIWWRKWWQYVKLDNIWPDRFVDDKINEDEILKLGEWLTEYNLDVLNKAIMDLNEKIPWKPLHPIIPTDIPTTLLTTRLISKLNEISKKNKKAKITIINENGKIEFKDPVEWDNGRWLELDYQSRFEMIDSDAKKIAEDVYAEALKLKNPKVLHAVKHQPWSEYGAFSTAMTNKDYDGAKEAIKPIFKKLDEEIKDPNISFSNILWGDKFKNLNWDALAQAMMAINNVFARSKQVRWWKENEYEFKWPDGRQKYMSAIIKEREKIQDTLNNKVDSSEAKEWYKSLFNAVSQYVKGNPKNFNVYSSKIASLGNTIGFNLWDKDNPENPLFNPEAYANVVDAIELEKYWLTPDAREWLHKRNMESFAKNPALVNPVLEMVWIETKDLKLKDIVKQDKMKMNWNRCELELDIWGKKYTLSSWMKFWFFPQCVNHMLILTDITITGEDGTSVKFNSSVMENGTRREGEKFTVNSTGSIGIHGSFVLNKPKTEPETEKETPPPTSTPTEDIIPPTEKPSTDPNHKEFDEQPDWTSTETQTTTPTGGDEGASGWYGWWTSGGRGRNR